MEAQPASELHSACFVVHELEKLLLESCCQQACCHLSVETLGAAPGLRLGLLSSPSGHGILTASRLQGPGCPPTATGYWLCPGYGASAVKTLPLLHSEASEGGTRQDAPGKCPGVLQPFTSWWTFLPQKYNADYDLSARQGADTLAFMSLLEEKLLPVLVSVPRPPCVYGWRGRGPGTHTPYPSPPPLSLGAAWG